MSIQSILNIYCDESCHLKNDDSDYMVLGAVVCNENKKNVFKDLRAIKRKYGLDEYNFEVKWTKVSASLKDFYNELVDYFFSSSDLHFRALIVPKKQVNVSSLDEWEEFYYKMYYQLLNNLITAGYHHYIYLDIKDTNGSLKRDKLKEILQTFKQRYFDPEEHVKVIQAVVSKEVELIQLADLLLGAVCYANRNIEKSNEGKISVIENIKAKTGFPLTETTLLSESKFNLFKIRLNQRWKGSR